MSRPDISINTPLNPSRGARPTGDAVQCADREGVPLVVPGLGAPAASRPGLRLSGPVGFPAGLSPRGGLLFGLSEEGMWKGCRGQVGPELGVALGVGRGLLPPQPGNLS